MIVYDKFFQLVKEKGIIQSRLREQGIHPRVWGKLKNGDLLRTDTINDLCRVLDCQPADIMEYVPDEEK